METMKKNSTSVKDTDLSCDAVTSISSRLRRRTKIVVQVSNAPVPQNKEAMPVENILLQEDNSQEFSNCSTGNLSPSTQEFTEKSEQPSKSKVKGFECTLCGRVTSSSQRLKEHLSRHTGEKHYQCDLCGKKFAWRYSFKSHMACHSNNNPNKCNICGKKYCNKSAVKNHILRIHSTPSKDFKCEKCDKSFLTKAELERHGFNHSTEKPFVCEYCGNAYRFKGALAVHYRVHSGERPYKCGFCDKTFIHMSSVIGHRRRHTGEMPFKCSLCTKRFRVKRAMTAHMSVHSEDRPFKCEKCAKTFRSRSGYRVHQDFHLGVKRHSCKYCGRAFRAWCNMHKHMRRHTGERPHVCETCGKSFIEKQELRNHMKCHNENSQKSGKKKDSIICVITNVDEPDDPPPVATSTHLSSCSEPFSEAPQPNAHQIPAHLELPVNIEPITYESMPSEDKTQQEKCSMLSDSYAPHYFSTTNSVPHTVALQYAPQSVGIQNLPQAAPVRNVHIGIQSNHLMSNTPPNMSNINSSNYSCANISNQHYSNFPLYMQRSNELLAKCKLCRSLFQSSLLLKHHLLEYHRIDEENINEIIA